MIETYMKEKVKFTQLWNGKFAICPRCKTITARNACGYWCCLFGCGLEFRVKAEKARTKERSTK